MNLRLLALTAGLAQLAAFSSVAPVFALDALGVVTKSQAAEGSVSYRGIKYADISVGKKTVRAEFKVTHQKPDRTRADYYSPADLSGIVTVDRGGDSWRYLPSTGEWQHTRWNPAPEPISLVLKNYNVESVGSAVIAGRPSYIIKFTPKKRGNPSETVWVDKSCYLPLRSELRNSSGTLISVSAFKQITIEPLDIPSSAFEVKASAFSSSSGSSGDLGFAVTKPGYVPKGYVLVQTGKIKIGTGYAAHLMYTNGVNTISIFQRKRGSDSGQKPPGLGKWATVLRFDRGSITYTIIGDIAKRELEKIAGSLK